MEPSSLKRINEQLARLEIETSEKINGCKSNDENEENYLENFNDEGYESKPETPKGNGAATPTPPITFKHRISTDPRTQHFSKTYNLFAYSSYCLVGQISARYIDRSLVSKSNFYRSVEDLNDGNSDGLAFATQLFCHRGTLMNKHRSDKWKYVGPWGSELEIGAVLSLKFLFVEKAFRRQGVAGMLIRELINVVNERMKKKPKGQVRFFVVFPAVVKEDFEVELEGKSEEEREAIERRAYDSAVRFYRAQGFRRIGLSKWFGLALDPGHKSHHLTVEDDLDPPDA